MLKKNVKTCTHNYETHVFKRNKYNDKLVLRLKAQNDLFKKSKKKKAQFVK